MCDHVAVSVSDIEEVIEWCSRVFRFKLVGKLDHTNRCENPDAATFGIYPETLNEVKLTWAVTSNGVGYELFGFIDPKHEPQQEFQFQKAGFFHACVTDTELDRLADKVVASGGRRIGNTVDPLGRGVKCLYVADPWRSVIKILNISFRMARLHISCAKSRQVRSAMNTSMRQRAFFMVFYILVVWLTRFVLEHKPHSKGKYQATSTNSILAKIVCRAANCC